MTPSNFLAAEPLIIARLRAVLPAHVHVLAAADLADVSADMQPTPAVHVLYQGYSVADNRTPAFAAVDQQWLTVIVARNLRDITGGFDARQDAGPLAAQVMDALYRHRLKAADGTYFGAAPLRLDSAPQAGFADGHFYLPLGWTAPITFGSDTCPS